MRRLAYILFLCLLQSGILMASHGDHLFFNHYSNLDGLSSNHVLDFYQDSEKLMWIATEDGLNLFDGYSFKIYKSDPKNKDGLKSSYFKCLSKHYNDYMFIAGTDNGLAVFNKKKDAFTEIFLTGLDIFDVLVTNDSTIWACTEKGLFVKTKREREFKHFESDIIIPGRVFDLVEDQNNYLWLIDNHNLIKISTDGFNAEIVLKDIDARELFFDSNSRLWYGTTYNGVSCVEDIENKKIVTFNKSIYPLTSNYYGGIIETSTDNFVIAMRDGGLYFLDYQTMNIRDESFSLKRNDGLKSNAITKIFQDSYGNIWIGYYTKGLSLIDRWRKPFLHFTYDDVFGNTQVSNNIRAIYQDRDGEIWIGSKEGGCLTRFLRDENRFQHYCMEENNPYSIKDDYIFSICDASPGYLWVGTYREGLALFDKNSGEFNHYLPNREQPGSIRSSSIYALEADSENNLYIGTVGEGMDYLARGSNKFRHFFSKPGDQDSLADYGVRNLFLDNDSILYIGTLKGFSIYHIQQNKFESLYTDPLNPYSLNSQTVNCVYVDTQGYIWLGTSSGGLNIFDREKSMFFAFTELDGLSNNNIWGIMEDDHHNLWLSTLNGLSKFTPPDSLDPEYLSENPDDRGEFTNYYAEDGLQGNNFERNAYEKINTGEMLFGGSNGFNLFHPDSIGRNPILPEVVFTDFKISNRKVEITGDDSPLKSHINYIEDLKLKFDQRNFSISYTGVNYSSTSKNKYKYILEGFDNEWINAGYGRTAVYTNIPAGDYIFKVIAANNDGMWNNTPREINMHISPPVWLSNFAILAYLIIILSGMFVSRRLILVREKLKRDLEITRINANKEKELNNARLELFTNISHELRTPLTLISLPVDEIIKKGSEELSGFYQDKLKIIKRNVIFLTHNINQILDLRKIDTGNLKLQLSEVNVGKLLQDIGHSFEPLFFKKELYFKAQLPDEDIIFNLDKDKIEKIFYNLISNAIKYTDKGGEIQVTIEKPEVGVDGQRNLNISVSDNGCGISNDEVNKIFDRFYRAKESRLKTGQGTGIGLAIVKAFIEIHGGSIHVESKLSEGSVFHISIPDHEIISDEYPGKKLGAEKGDSIDLPDVIIDDSYDEQVDESSFDKDKYTILLVEDNEELRKYMVDVLKDKFNLIQAADGESGLKKAVLYVPDIVVTDIMMPKKNGIELTRDLKENKITSHIPVVILTAKSTLKDQLSGISTGAIEYIIKPFSVELLLLKINNLLEYRRDIHKRLEELNINDTSVDLNISKYDIEFLNLCSQKIEENILLTKFGVPELCEIMGMSKTQLYNKFKAITNKPLGEYIKEIKLKKAASMLIEERLSVSEVAFSLGFSNRSHFARSFRVYFGELPSEYKKSQLGKNQN